MHFDCSNKTAAE